MKNNKIPPFAVRLFSVWYRHYKVYTKNFISNGFPPFLEPIIFLAGIGLGLGMFIKEMDGVPFVQFLASGLLISTAMMTSAFECTFGTFIRLEFEKAYDGMVAAPITAENLLVGEILWAGTKGFFFSFAVLVVVYITGIMRTPAVFFIPFVGLLTGLMFSSFSILITSFIKVIDNFNFYFTGFLSPMMFLSGIIFPVSNLPPFLRPLAEMLPLTHPVRIARAICFNRWSGEIVWDFAYILLFIAFSSFFGVKRLKKRIID